MIGEILADFGHDPVLHVRMKGPAQVGERPRRRGIHQGGDGAAAHHSLQCRGNAFDKTMLLEVMPVGLLHAAAAMRAGAGEGRARLVGPLFMGRRIVVGENLLGFQFRKFLVTVVAQEQRLASIADEINASCGIASLFTSHS